jgi:tetratricopeptide (TPR) repeat protein
MRRLIGNLIFLFLLSGRIWAQQPAMHENLALYLEAQELYDKGKYGAAKEHFRQFANRIETKSSLPAEANDLLADARFFQAMCSYQLLNSDAGSLFWRFIRQFPTHPKRNESLFHIGKLAYIRKDYVAAVEPIGQLDMDYLSKEQVTEARFILGYGHFRKGDSTKAKEKFGQIRLAGGTYGELGAYYYAVIAYQQKEYSNAYDAFMRVKPDAKYAENLDVLKASCLLKLGRYDELNALAKELLLDGSHSTVETWFILANAAYDKQRWTDCLRYFTEFETRRGRMNREGQYRMGHAYFRTDNFQKARERFEKALSPEDAVAQSAYYYLGHCFLKLENFENARTAFLQASEEPYNKEIAGEALYLYAKASFETRYFDDALDAMRRFVEGWPNSSYLPEAKSLIGEMLVYTSNYKDAIDYLEQNGGAKTQRAQLAFQRACYLYALSQFEKNRYDIAGDYFKRAFNNRQDPSITLPAYYWYAEALYRKKDYKPALNAFDEFIDQPYAGKSPYFALAHYGAAWCELRLNQFDASLNRFEKYLGLADRQKDKELYTDAMLRAGDCEFMLKHYPESMKYYKQVRDYNHMHVDYALIQMGKLYFRMNDYQKAAESNVQLVTNYRKSTLRDQALINASDMYLTWLNDPASAIKYCKMLEKDHPDSPLLVTAYSYLAVAEDRNGNTNASIQYNKTIAFEHCADEKARTTALNSLADKLDSDAYDKVEAESRRRCPFQQNGGSAITESVDLALTIADQRYFEDNYASAIDRYTNFLSDFPGNPKMYHAYYYRGQCYEKLKDKEKAIENYRKVYEADQINEFSLKALKSAADLHFAAGNSLAAMELYSQMEGRSEKLEDRLSAQFGKANIHLANKDYEAARRELLVIYTDGNTTEYSRMKARVQIAVCDYNLNRKDIAYNEFLEIETLDKKVFGAESQYYVTRILFDRGSYEQSRDTAIYLKDKYPSYNLWKAKAFLILAEDYLQLGDTFQAVKGTLSSLALQDAYPEIQKQAQTRISEIDQVWTGSREPKPLDPNEGGTNDDVNDLIKEEGDQ